MTPLGCIIVDLIDALGPLPVGEYMNVCLSDPRHGYYMTRDPFGRGGDFVTAPEISQMFGELVGAWLAAAWEAAAFARFLGELRNLGRMEDASLDAVTAGACLSAAAKAIEQLSAAVGVTARPSFSLLASNGRVAVATARGGAAVSYTLLEGRAECARHELTADALAKNPTLDGLQAYVSDSGEGRWTVFEAIDLNVSAPVITESLIRRIRSREDNNFTDRMLSIMRNAFGGHAVKKD